MSLVNTDTSLPASAKLLAASVGTLLVDPKARPNPHLAFQNLAENGYGVCEVDAQKLAVSLFSLSTDAVATAPEALTMAVSDLFTEQRFEVDAGAADLFQIDGAARQRWDIASMSWVSAS